jgi:hypothetical protein
MGVAFLPSEGRALLLSEGSSSDWVTGLLPATILILDFLAPQTGQNQFLLFINYPACGILFQQYKQIKAVPLISLNYFGLENIIYEICYLC